MVITSLTGRIDLQRVVRNARFQVAVIKNFKLQNTNTKQIPMTENQNPKPMIFDLI
jgi:hypothetical protein